MMARVDVEIEIDEEQEYAEARFRDSRYPLPYTIWLHTTPGETEFMLNDDSDADAQLFNSWGEGIAEFRKAVADQLVADEEEVE